MKMETIYTLKTWAEEQEWYKLFSNYPEILKLLDTHADWPCVYDPESYYDENRPNDLDYMDEIAKLFPLNDENDTVMGDGRGDYLCVEFGTIDGMDYLWIGAGCPLASALLNLHVAPSSAERAIKLIYGK